MSPATTPDSPQPAADLSPREVEQLYRGRAEDPSYKGEPPEPRFFVSGEEEDELGGRKMVLNIPRSATSTPASRNSQST
jgi:hypothetical protein